MGDKGDQRGQINRTQLGFTPPSSLFMQNRAYFVTGEDDKACFFLISWQDNDD
jgi:hypothetical protein